MEAITNINYSNVLIELDAVDNLNALYESIKQKGDSKIKISINKEDKNYLFELKDKRKFDYKTLKFIKEYTLQRKGRSST